MPEVTQICYSQSCQNRQQRKHLH